jgi:hypothetical protein
VEEYGTARQVTDDNIIRRMRFACRITKATGTHSEYVIIIAFPRQQWLRERVSILRCTYHCLSSRNTFVAVDTNSVNTAIIEVQNLVDHKFIIQLRLHISAF